MYKIFIFFLIFISRSLAETEPTFGREMVLCETAWDVTPVSCCNIPDPKLTKHQENAFKQALKQFHDRQNGCKEWVTFYQKTMKIYTKNGNVDLRKIKEIFIKMSRDKRQFNLWNSTVTKSVKYCADKIPMPKIDPKETSTCNLFDRISGIVMCVMQQNFINCPSSIMKSSKVCNEMKHFAKSPRDCYEGFGKFGTYPKLDFYYNIRDRSGTKNQNQKRVEL